MIFELHPCPYLVLLIRVNLCNLWMIILKDWIPGQARNDTVDSLGVVVFRLDTRPNPVLLIRVNLCKLRAAEVCSAEATELPVWERPPVSVANGLCHPLGTGSRVPRFTQIYADKRRRLSRIGVI